MRKTVGLSHKPKALIRSSSMVEQEAVNFEVAGSSPASGAKIIVPAKRLGLLF